MLRRYGADGLSEKRWSNINDIQRFMLWEDPIFERLTYNPAGLGLAQWLLGTDCVLSLCAAWVKGPGEVRTGIHGDYLDPALVAQPEPRQQLQHALHAHGLHQGRRRHLLRPRQPSLAAAGDAGRLQAYWQDRATPVEAPAGSMVIWGNHTWHGSYPKKTPGLRMTLQCEYMRRRRQTEEAYRETVTQEALDRNPVRFAGLMDVYSLFPFGKSDWDMDRMNAAEPGAKNGQTIDQYRSLFDTEPAAGRTTIRPTYDYMHHDGKMTSERNAERAERMKREREAQAASEPGEKAEASAS